jgi:hypothetical protein
LRAAAAELERERAATRAEAVARAQAEAERDRLSVVAAAPAVTKGEEPADSKSFRAQGKGWKVAVPVGIVTAIVAPVVALGQHFVALERTVSAQTQAIAGYQKSLDAQTDQIRTQGERITELTATVARLSGFLAGAFPKLGLQVTAEPGATAIEVKSDRLPPSTPRRAQVRVTTPIPAPAATATQR